MLFSKIVQLNWRNWRTGAELPGDTLQSKNMQLTSCK